MLHTIFDATAAIKNNGPKPLPIIRLYKKYEIEAGIIETTLRKKNGYNGIYCIPFPQNGFKPNAKWRSNLDDPSSISFMIIYCREPNNINDHKYSARDAYTDSRRARELVNDLPSLLFDDLAKRVQGANPAFITPRRLLLQNFTKTNIDYKQLGHVMTQILALQIGHYDYRIQITPSHMINIHTRPDQIAQKDWDDVYDQYIQESEVPPLGAIPATLRDEIMRLGQILCPHIKFTLDSESQSRLKDTLPIKTSSGLTPVTDAQWDQVLQPFLTRIEQYNCLTAQI